MAISFFLEYRNAQKVQLPVNPEEFEVECPGANETESVVEYGDVSLLRRPGLKQVSFTSFIPSAKTGGYVERNANLQSGQFYIDFITAVRINKEPIRLIVTDLGVNIQMSVEEFSYRWDGSDADMYYTLSLREYRKPEIKIARVQVPVVPAPPVASANPPRANTPKQLAVGVTVRVNGRLHRDSYGGGPGQTEKNATRRVSHLIADASRKKPVHVVTLEGGYRGWVGRNEVEVI